MTPNSRRLLRMYWKPASTDRRVGGCRSPAAPLLRMKLMQMMAAENNAKHRAPTATGLKA